jgi:hypothetical protein
MITAKNYAAQASRGLMSQAIVAKDPKNMAPNAKEYGDAIMLLSKLIDDSVHFALPDDGVILDGGGFSLAGQTVHLPFKRITIEYFVFSETDPQKGESFDNKRVVIAEEISRSELCGLPVLIESEFYIKATCVTYHPGHNLWVPDGGFSITPCTGWDTDLGDSYAISPIQREKYKGIVADCFPFKFHGGVSPRLIESIKQDSVSNVRSIFELIEALSCRNVSTVNHQDASPANAKRIKAGKLPIYETKMLVVDTNYTPSGKTREGGSHASPRQHLRRGHIRRLQCGNIWVNSCVVGDPSKGRIDKQYIVK